MEAGTPNDAAGETLDRLAGDWWIFQLRRGHRYATDDVLTAWTASRAHPAARTILDLGAGVGALGLLALLRAPPEARLLSVEVQEVSVALARKTVAHNQLGGRVEIRQGDLRAPGVLGSAERFDLVLANPPYLPAESAWRSPNPQRAAARLELHGDIADYCRAAARHLAPGGRFCFCHAAADPRPERALIEVGLAVLSRQEVVFREGRPPVIALYACGREGARLDLPALIVRDRQGRRTEAYRAVRREMLIEE
jgi:tRNA1(Val) A37 N6-methylase TrmN6